MSKMELIAWGTLIDRESWEKVVLQWDDRLIDIKENTANGSTVTVGKWIEVIRNGVRDVVTSIEEYSETVQD